MGDAFQACPTLHRVYPRLLKLTLEELRVIEDHPTQLDQQMADLLAAHHDAVQRLAEVLGLGVDSARQIVAEVRASAATFHGAHWVQKLKDATPAGVLLDSANPVRGRS